MSREIFFGTVEVSREGVVRPQRGLGQDLTVATSLTQVNVNYASEFVLRSLPEMSPELARAIIQERARAPFKSLEDIGRRTALSLPDEALPFLATGEGKTYSIVSVGELAGSRVQRAVRAVVQIDPQGIPRHRVVAWYDDYSSD
jgi:type II secretory pathway component PulK